MARLHTRKGGRARRSKKKYPRTSPSWLEMEAKEVEDLVEKLAREGKEPSVIGNVLRDQYAVPDVKAITGKSITQILSDRELLPQYPEDLMSLIKRAVRMRKHLQNNRSDIHNRVKLQHVESKIRRLVKYYNRVGRLNNWKYDPKTAALLVK